MNCTRQMRTCDWIVFSLFVSYLGNKTAQSRSALTPRENVKGRKEEGIPGEGRCAFHLELQCPSVLLSSTGPLVAPPRRLVLIQCVCMRVRVRPYVYFIKANGAGVSLCLCKCCAARYCYHHVPSVLSADRPPQSVTIRGSEEQLVRITSRIQCLRCCFIWWYVEGWPLIVL